MKPEKTVCKLLIAIITVFVFQNSYGQNCTNEQAVLRVDYLQTIDTITVDTTKWHYIALTKNNQNGSLYIDGQLVFTSSFQNVPYIWNSLVLGGTQACVSCSIIPDYNGLVDEVRLSNVARTSSEISSYYQSNQPFKADNSTLGLFHFDSSNGNIMLNSANTNNGTLYGSPVYIGGKFGNALKLNGISQYASFLQTIPVDNMTVELWFHTNSNDSGAALAMMAYAYNTRILIKTINTPIVPTTKHLSLTGCNSVVFNSKIYTASTVVRDTVKSLLGCDSVYNIVNITINTFKGFNPLQDTIRVCGDSVSLNAGIGFSKYVWSNGDTLYSINARQSGIYKVTVTDSNGCMGSDRSYISIVKAKVFYNDSTINKGSSITLGIDSSNWGSTTGQLPANLQNRLSAYYPFNGNPNDLSGNHNDGVSIGATLTTDRFGRLNNAYNFNGSSYITAPNSPSLQVDSAITISVWAYYDSLYSHYYSKYGSCSILSKSYSLGFDSIGYTTPSNYYYIDFNNYNQSCEEVKDTLLTSNKNWHNIVVVSSNSGGNIYIDGLKKGKFCAYSLVNTTDPLNIGTTSNIYSFGTPWIGKLDDIGIWNRSLTDTEIEQLYSLKPSATYTVKWSTGDTTPSITVTPMQTTKYYVSVTDGITTCNDSVTVFVNQALAFSSINLSAMYNNSATTITWSAEAGLSTSEFLVQKSLNGTNFFDIDTTLAVGNGSNSYSYLDNSPTANGEIYYRIKGVDKDGSSIYSRVVTVIVQNNKLFSISPNPAHSLVTVNFYKPTPATSVNIYDARGAKIFSQSFNGPVTTFQLSTQRFPAGVYIVEAKTEATSYTQKLLIIR